MAIKRVNKNDDFEVQVDVNNQVDVTTDTEEPLEQVDESVEVEQTPIVDFGIEEPEKKEEPSVDVNEEAFEEDSTTYVEKIVKIRMRVDHRCFIAMQRYDLKAGQTYNVPVNVKDILNRAGLLSPL